MRKRLAVTVVLMMMLLTLMSLTAHAEWVGSGSNRRYKNADGTYASGLVNIEGRTFFFTPAGKLRTNRWVTVNRVKYYVDRTGSVATNRWIGKKYYVTADGTRAKGFVTIADKIYFFDRVSGKLVRGRFRDGDDYYWAHLKKGYLLCDKMVKKNGRQYYAAADGKLATGLAQIHGLFYYFNSNGVMVKQKRVVINGSTYYFQKNGAAARNKWVRIGGKRYWFDENGRMATNQVINGRWYVGADGARVKASIAASGMTVINGKYFSVDASGQISRDQWVTVGGKTYYLGSDGAALTGKQTIGGSVYFFEADGSLKTNTMVLEGNVAYLIAKDGKVTLSSTVNGTVIAQYAQKFVGNPYVYGGTSLTNGADCSGFAMSVFAQFGIKLLRVANDQMHGPSQTYISSGYTPGTKVTQSQLLPGDLVFYGASGYASHVSIYIGNNQVVHAVNSRTGIKVTPINWTGTPIKYMRYWK